MLRKVRRYKKNLLLFLLLPLKKLEFACNSTIPDIKVKVKNNFTTGVIITEFERLNIRLCTSEKWKLELDMKHLSARPVKNKFVIIFDNI